MKDDASEKILKTEIVGSLEGLMKPALPWPAWCSLTFLIAGLACASSATARRYDDRIRCGLDFFGSEQVVFATDCPFDPEGGPMFIRTIPEAIDGLNLSQHEQEGIYFRNALRLLKMPCDC